MLSTHIIIVPILRTVKTEALDDFPKDIYSSKDIEREFEPTSDPFYDVSPPLKEVCLFSVEVLLMYTVILVSGVLHSDLMFAFIMK